MAFARPYPEMILVERRYILGIDCGTYCAKQVVVLRDLIASGYGDGRRDGSLAERSVGSSCMVVSVPKRQRGGNEQDGGDGPANRGKDEPVRRWTDFDRTSFARCFAAPGQSCLIEDTHIGMEFRDLVATDFTARKMKFRFAAAHPDQEIVESFFGKMCRWLMGHYISPRRLRTEVRARCKCVLTVFTGIPRISLISETGISSENFIKNTVR